MAEPTESLFTATKTELEWKHNPPAPPTAAEVVLATKSPSWLLRKASGTWHTWLRDSMLEVDLPLNTDTISCLEWHPRESILAVGTWCGYVLIYDVSDIYTRGERSVKEDTERWPDVGIEAGGASHPTAGIQATLRHRIPVGVPVLSMAWRPLGRQERYGADAEEAAVSALAVVGASDTVGLVLPGPGVLIPAFTVPPGTGPLFRVVWAPSALEVPVGGEDCFVMANLSPDAGTPYCSGLVVASFESPVLFGIADVPTAALQAATLAGPSEAGGVWASFGIPAALFELARLPGLPKALDSALGLVYAVCHPCKTTVLRFGNHGSRAEQSLLQLDEQSPALHRGGDLAAANPQRVGSFLAAGHEGRCAVAHAGRVGNGGDLGRQRFIFKCHRSGDKSSDAAKPTAVRWLRGCEGHEAGRCLSSRARPGGMIKPDEACLEPLAAGAPGSQVPLLLQAYEVLRGATPASLPPGLFSRRHGDGSGVDGASGPAVDHGQDGAFLHAVGDVVRGLATPPSPAVLHAMASSHRFVRGAKGREFILSGQQFITGGSDGEVVVWDVDRRMRTRQLPLQVKNEVGAMETLPVSAVEFDCSGTFMAIAYGRMWTKGDPDGCGAVAWDATGARRQALAASGGAAAESDASPAEPSRVLQQTRLLLIPVVSHFIQK